MKGTNTFELEKYFEAPSDSSLLPKEINNPYVHSNFGHEI